MNKLAKLTSFVMLLLTCILIVGCKGKNPTKKISKIISEIICDKLNQSSVYYDAYDMEFTMDKNHSNYEDKIFYFDMEYISGTKVMIEVKEEIVVVVEDICLTEENFKIIRKNLVKGGLNDALVQLAYGDLVGKTVKRGVYKADWTDSGKKQFPSLYEDYEVIMLFAFYEENLQYPDIDIAQINSDANKELEKLRKENAND